MKYPLLIASCLALAASSVGAQNASNSPYSRYGFGLLNHRSNAAATQMSGTSLGFRDGNFLNANNPASYSAIDSLSLLFDVGITLQNGNFDENGQKINAKNSSLDYITAGFRLAPRLGLAVGISPFSTVGYEIHSSTSFNNNNTGDVVRTEQFHGDGGLHVAFLGLGWAPIPQLSLGVNAGYMWGELNNRSTVMFNDPSINRIQRIYHSNPHSYKLDVALQYEQHINKKHSLTLGAKYGWGHEMKGDAQFYNQSTSGMQVVGDTVSVGNAFELPHTISAGIAWNYNDKLRLGVDYEWQKWKDIKSPQLGKNNQFTVAKGHFNDLRRYSFGAEYIPNKHGISKVKQIRYRVGAAYTSPYTRINTQNSWQDGPQHFEVSAGVGIPIINYHGYAKNRCVLNIGASYERVAPKHNAFLKENYLRIHIGLTFNERWFAKWKAQ